MFQRLAIREMGDEERTGTLDADWTLSSLPETTENYNLLSAEMRSGAQPTVHLGKKTFELKW